MHITIGDPDFHDPAHHETASKFLGQKFLGLNIRQAHRLDRFLLSDNLDGLRSADPVQCGLNGVHLARETDEEAGFRNSPDLVTCMGPNEIAAQERDRARRSLRAHRPDRRRQTGLFDEVRQFADAAVTAAAG
jgi:hypothetical protein